MAGQSRQSGTVTGSAGTVYYTGTTNNPAAAQAAQQRASAQTGAMVSQAQALHDADKAALDGRALLAQSLDPGVTFTGDVLFDMPKAERGQPSTITATVTVAGELVTATFTEAADE